MTLASTPTSNSHGARNRAIWITIAAVCLALGGTVFFNHSVGLSPTEAAAATVEDASLHLKVLPDANRVVLSWDQDADLAATADRATLTISDGNRTESVDLDLNYVRLGRIAYLPLTHDVSFRLRVSSMKQGRTASGYVRLLNFQPQEDAQAALLDTTGTDQTAADDSMGAATITVDAFPSDDNATTPASDQTSVTAPAADSQPAPASDARAIADARMIVATVAQAISK